MKGWRLLVWNAPADDKALRKMGLRPMKKNPRVLIGRYAAEAEPQLRRHIAMLKERGLHGKAVRGNTHFSPPGRDADPSPASRASRRAPSRRSARGAGDNGGDDPAMPGLFGP